MGNHQSGVSERLIKSIKDKTVWIDLYADNSEKKRLVPLNRETASLNSYDEDMHFVVHPVCSIPKMFNLSLLFPRFLVGGGIDTPGTERILQTKDYSTLAALNMHLNEMLYIQASIPLAVCWYDTMYAVSGLKPGNKVYLLWACQISVSTIGEEEIFKTGDIPLLVATDGHYESLAVYPLTTDPNWKQYINTRRLKWALPNGSDQFVVFPCDTPRPKKTFWMDDAATTSSSIVIEKLTEEEARIMRDCVLVPRTESTSPTLAERDEDDRALEFFSRGADEDDAVPQSIERRVMAHVTSLRQMEDLVREQKEVWVGEDETPPNTLRLTDIPLISVERGSRIPVGLIARKDHRQGANAPVAGRIMVVPRGGTSSSKIAMLSAAAATYSATTTDSDSDTGTSAGRLPMARKPSHTVHPSVTPLRLGSSPPSHSSSESCDE